MQQAQPPAPFRDANGGRGGPAEGMDEDDNRSRRRNHASASADGGGAGAALGEVVGDQDGTADAWDAAGAGPAPPAAAGGSTGTLLPTEVVLLLLSLQFGLQPLLNGHLLSPGASKTSVVLVTETHKTACAWLIIRLRTTADEREELLHGWSLRSAVMRAGLPAAMYALTNWLLLLVSAVPGRPRLRTTDPAPQASRNLPALTLSLLNQTKTLSAALWSYVLLGRGQTAVQVLALLMLALGAFLVVNADERAALTLPTSTGAAATPSSSAPGATSLSGAAAAKFDDRDTAMGFAAVSTASMVSGLASALTERALMRNASTAWSLVFSMEIAVFGILALACSVAAGVNADFSRSWPLQGWTLARLVPCLTSAVGELLVGLVSQRAGGVRKGFALIAGLCLTCFAEASLGYRQLLPAHLVAVGLVGTSMWLHAWSASQKLLRGKLRQE